MGEWEIDGRFRARYRATEAEKEQSESEGGNGMTRASMSSEALMIQIHDFCHDANRTPAQRIYEIQRLLREEDGAE